MIDTREPFLTLSTLGCLIALSPLAGILFDVKPIPVLSFLISAMFVWVVLCILFWIKEHQKLEQAKHELENADLTELSAGTTPK